MRQETWIDNVRNKPVDYSRINRDREVLKASEIHFPTSQIKKINHMKNLQLTQAPIAKAEMLIRKPIAQVFEAFINPEITTQFWFTKSSGRLEPGKQVRWDWEMYGVSTLVNVKEVEENKRILIEWGSPEEKTTSVEWIFTSYGNEATFVSVTNSGFQGDGDEIVAQALDSTGGFTWILAGLKAYLEHNIMLNLIADRFPKGFREH